MEVIDKSKFLSGEELVARSGTKLNVSLPEVGVKDILPNGSWLEQKHIESALEARKHLIEIPRIEKSGTISQANWNEDLMLAEVTKQIGSHWQFLGHHIDKRLYLKPEEALYLMEVNSLLLKYNEVTVSMQQAYSLLLRGKVTPLKYQVYSSLSRVGYKVFQHEYKTLEKVQVDSKIIEVKSEGIETISSNEDKQSSQNAEAKSERMELGSEENTNKIENIAGSENKAEKIEVQQETEEVLAKSVLNDNNCLAFSCTEEETTSSDVQIDGTSEKRDLDRKSENIEDTKNITGNKVETKNVDEPEYTNLTQSYQENNSDVVCVSNVEKDKETCKISEENLNSVEENHLSKNNDSRTPKTETNNYQLIKDVPKIGNTNDDQAHVADIYNETSADEISLDTSIKNTEGNESDNTDVVIADSSSNMDVDKNSIIEIDSEIENEHYAHDSGKTKTTSVNSKITECDAGINEQKIINRKLQILQKRNIKQCNPDSLTKSFENFPDFYEKTIVTVNVPKEELIPKNVFCNNTSYVIVAETIRNKTKDNRRSSIETRSYSESDEVNGAHVRRVRDTIEPSKTSDPVSLPNNFNSNANQRYFRPQQQFRQPHFWRPRFYFPPNFMFQRGYFAPYLPRFNLYPRIPFWRPPFNPTFNANFYNSNDNNLPRNFSKRDRKTKKCHLDAIKRLAQRLKIMVAARNTSIHNVEALQSLIQTYNIRYKTNIKLSDDFEVMDGDTILETIELEDEEEPKTKRRKIEPKTQKYEENFKGLKKLALRLREMADKNALTSRHRRAFSNVIKEFNKTYNADVYMNEHYQVVDRRCVTLDSSSESDCVVEDTPPPPPSGKLVRNPFNILKRLSQRQDYDANKALNSDENLEKNTNYKIQYEKLKQIFGEKWLPKEDDFGRAELVPRSLKHAIFVDSKKEEYFYDFFKNQQYHFCNWLDMKLAFFSSFEEPVQYDSSIIEEDQCDIKPIICQEDGLDMPAILSKLSIIKNKKEVATESSLSVDFDAYNRDVQNFKKSNPPQPHFRVVCLSDKSPFPSNDDIAALHSKYSDDVTILFAIVCDGAVSYLQMNHVETPVYMPSNDMDFT